MTTTKPTPIRTGYRAAVIADTISADGDRITTIEATYPRIIHSEMMTHRMFARNAMSSRAVPVEAMIVAVIADPFVPERFTARKKGMQGGETDDRQDDTARHIWQIASRTAANTAQALVGVDIHKQHANRLLEPFSWITAIYTGTQRANEPGAWSNFFAQRCHTDAQPEMQTIAMLMQTRYDLSTPLQRVYHIPYVTEYEYCNLSAETLQRISSARCARVSYLNHDRSDPDPGKDLALCADLIASGHWSPLEHPARVLRGSHGCYWGWRSFRHFNDGEFR